MFGRWHAGFHVTLRPLKPKLIELSQTLHLVYALGTRIGASDGFAYESDPSPPVSTFV